MEFDRILTGMYLVADRTINFETTDKRGWDITNLLIVKGEFFKINEVIQKEKTRTITKP